MMAKENLDLIERLTAAEEELADYKQQGKPSSAIRDGCVAYKSSTKKSAQKRHSAYKSGDKMLDISDCDLRKDLGHDDLMSELRTNNV